MTRNMQPRRAGVLFAVAVAVLMGLRPWAVAQHAGHYGSKSDSKEAIQSVQRLQPKRVMTVKGDEDWDSLTGFGKDSSMAEMMTLMMVGGSGMEHMKMGPMRAGKKRADSGAITQSSGLPLAVTVTPNPPVV